MFQAAGTTTAPANLPRRPAAPPQGLGRSRTPAALAASRNQHTDRDGVAPPPLGGNWEDPPALNRSERSSTGDNGRRRPAYSVSTQFSERASHNSGRGVHETSRCRRRDRLRRSPPRHQSTVDELQTDWASTSPTPDGMAIVRGLFVPTSHHNPRRTPKNDYAPQPMDGAPRRSVRAHHAVPRFIAHWVGVSHVGPGRYFRPSTRQQTSLRILREWPGCRRPGVAGAQTAVPRSGSAGPPAERVSGIGTGAAWSASTGGVGITAATAGPTWVPVRSAGRRRRRAFQGALLHHCGAEADAVFAERTTADGHPARRRNRLAWKTSGANSASASRSWTCSTTMS